MGTVLGLLPKAERIAGRWTDELAVKAWTVDTFKAELREKCSGSVAQISAMEIHEVSALSDALGRISALESRIGALEAKEAFTVKHAKRIISQLRMRELSMTRGRSSRVGLASTQWSPGPGCIV